MLNTLLPTKKILNIRSAKASDISQILPLMDQLGYPQSCDQFKKQFNIFINQKDYGVVVAENDKEIVGCIAWSTSVLFVSSTIRIRIEGLIVDKKYRGQKIGKALMLYVEEFAQHFSPCIIELTSGLRRKEDGSHQFYASLGYQNEGAMAKVYLRKQI